MLSECLAGPIDIRGQREPDGPAIRGIDASHARKLVVRKTRICGGDDRPSAAIPVLGQGVSGAPSADVSEPDSPASELDAARDTTEHIAPRGRDAGGADDGPGCAVPVLGEGLVGPPGAAGRESDRPAVGAISARHAREIIGPRGLVLGVVTTAQLQPFHCWARLWAVPPLKDVPPTAQQSEALMQVTPDRGLSPGAETIDQVVGTRRRARRPGGRGRGGDEEHGSGRGTHRPMEAEHRTHGGPIPQRPVGAGAVTPTVTVRFTWDVRVCSRVVRSAGAERISSPRAPATLRQTGSRRQWRRGRARPSAASQCCGAGGARRRWRRGRCRPRWPFAGRPAGDAPSR